MIIVYYSNRLEHLKKMLFEVIIDYQSNNVFCSEIVLVDNIFFIEWLYIELARHFGVSANIEFFFPYNFIWDIVHKSLWNIFPKSAISRSMFPWIFMKIFSDIDNNYINTGWSTICEYLCNDFDKRKCLQLSEKITDLFIQYFIYRQDWLLQWELGKTIHGLDECSQFWQSELWRLFLHELDQNNNFVCYFRYNIYEYIINVLKNKNINSTKLPKRIFIYAVSSFPPVLLEILEALGKYINIYIFCINPCRFFLKNNLIDRNMNNSIRMDDQSPDYFYNIGSLNIFNRWCFLSDNNEKYNLGNSLLSAWGGMFQETFYVLSQLEIIHEQSIFYLNTQNIRLLQILQNDILNDYSHTVNNFKINNSAFDIKQRLLFAEDSSLSVHVCHNIQREVEILFDNILMMMSNDSLLLPHEIIVMAPNIDNYVSSIRSVFNYSATRGRYLPFTIFDSIKNNTNITISSVFKLLKISSSRFSIEEILDFLNVPSLAMRFDIDEEGVRLLTKWILESGIRWGLDDEMFSTFVMASVTNIQCTWKFGLNRMFLGYAINSASGPWDQVLPYNISNTNNDMLYNLIGQLNKFLITLKYWKDKFTKSYILKEWLPLFEDIINDFYINNFNTETESNLLLLKNCWRDIVVSGIKANYCSPVSIIVLHDKLYNKFNKTNVKQRSFSGGIIFCSLSSIHSVPFKVVCLLGMNADYSNSKKTLNFDLMNSEVRIGDYNSSYCNSNRYLFLESLLSARELFYISFIGYSMNDDKKHHPSMLINELFEYIVHHFFYIEKNGDILSVTMDWVYTNLWNWHTCAPYLLGNFISGSKNQSFFKEWLFSFDNNNTFHMKFRSSLSTLPIKEISLDNLYNFYINPIQAWFKNRLHIYIPKKIEIFSDEPFFVDYPVQYQICRDLISCFLDKLDVNILYQSVRFSGILPYGSFGDIFWIKQCESMMQLSQVIYQYYYPNNRYNLKISLLLNTVRLTGVLHSIQKNGVLRWRPRLLSMRDGLLLWLEHLVYCAMGGEGHSWMFGINSSWHFRSLSVTKAKKYLLFLICGYINGMNSPLLLFNHIGEQWLRCCFDAKKKSLSCDIECQNKARRRLIMAWEKECYVYETYHDPYVRILIPKLSNEDIESIILATKSYFLPLMQFNVKID